MKNVPFLFLLLLLASVNCKKQDDPQRPTEPAGPDKIKIEVLKGDNQWDTIGQRLTDSIIIKLTRADTILKNYAVQFTDSSCSVASTANKKTSNLGLAEYSWQLNTTNGTQRLKVSIYDSVLKISDSIFVNADGRMPDSAWLPGSCLPPGRIVTLAQLSSGRIFCGLFINSAPYYSDDNGQSWQKFDLFPYNYVILKICISANDEIYIATQDNGIYYSADKGQSWQPRSNGITDTRLLTDFSILRSGRLMAGTHYGGLFYSFNRGLSWTRVSATLSADDNFFNFCESPSGDFYTINDFEELFRSKDNGTTWSRVSYAGIPDVQSIFIDDNGDMYIGADIIEGHIFKSVDNGSTWSKLFTTPELPAVYDRIKNISKKNGNYYFSVDGYGLVRTNDFIKYDKISISNQDYLVAKSGTVLLNFYFSGLFYNHQP